MYKTQHPAFRWYPEGSLGGTTNHQRPESTPGGLQPLHLPQKCKHSHHYVLFSKCTQYFIAGHATQFDHSFVLFKGSKQWFENSGRTATDA